MSSISKPKSVLPTFDQDKKYAILQETSPDNYESWLYFILYNGNEEALLHLDRELAKIKEYCVIEDCSIFDLELNYLVSEQTAYEMCLVDLNAGSRNRKFDGKLEKIEFGFYKKDKDDDRIIKVHEALGMGDIDKFVDNEQLFGDEVSTQGDSDSEYSDTDKDSDDEEEKKSPIKDVICENGVCKLKNGPAKKK